MKSFNGKNNTSHLNTKILIKSILIGIFLCVFSSHNPLQASCKGLVFKIYEPGSAPANIPQTQLQKLVDDMALYKTSNKNHQGHLLFHSIWVAKTIKKWFNKKHSWCKDIDEKYKNIMTWAAFFHDIGKAGDLNTNFFAKEYHAENGFYYLNGTQKYKVVKNEAQFDFGNIFKELNFTQEEIKLVQILTAMHYDFGSIVMAQTKYYKNKNPYETFLTNLQKWVTKAKYNNKKIDRKIVAMSALIGSADVRGMREQVYSEEITNNDIIIYVEKQNYVNNYETGTNFYTHYKFTEKLKTPAQWKGIIQKNFLVDHFKSKEKKEIPQIVAGLVTSLSKLKDTFINLKNTLKQTQKVLKLAIYFNTF